MPGEAGLGALAARDLPEVQALLEVGNPTTHARPGEHGDEAWVGVRDGAGQLVACAVMERNGCRAPAPGRHHGASRAAGAGPGAWP